MDGHPGTGDGCPADADCNDADNSVFTASLLYTDVDGDGWTVEPAGSPATMCHGVTTPAGTAATSLGQDCDDASSAFTASCRAALVMDINPAAAVKTGDAAPHLFSVTTTSVRGSATAFFVATSPNEGTELWSTTGNSRATNLVADLTPGTASTNIVAITSGSSGTWFLVNEGNTGAIWKTDGTGAGTQFVFRTTALIGKPVLQAFGTGVLFESKGGSSNPVLSFLPGVGASPVVIRECSGGVGQVWPTTGKFYFHCYDGYALPLFASDGTTAGTHGITGASQALYTLHDVELVGSTAYALASRQGSPAGTVLFKTTGTTAVEVWHASEDTCQDDAHVITHVGSTIYFTGDSNGCELFSSNGTTATKVKELVSGANNATGPANLTPFSGKLYFSLPGSRQLWRSDGTAAGTVAAADVRSSGDAMLSQFKVVGTRLLFQGTDGPASDLELWSFDGTTAARVADFVPGTGGGASFTESALVNGLLILNAKIGTGAARQLVASNGTTMNVVDPIHVTTFGSNPYVAGVFGSQLLVGADDGVQGLELWKSDGLAAGTALVKDINPGMEDSVPAGMLDMGSFALFTAKDGFGVELWKTDGTSNGTSMMADINPGAPDGFPSSLVKMPNGKVFFVGTSDVGTELWATDGTTNGTAMVKDIRAGVDSSSPAFLTPLGNVVGFAATNAASGTELWRSDGTTNGTYLVKEIGPTAESSSPHNLAVFGGRVFFSAGSMMTGPELWSSDLTPNGTSLVMEIAAGATGSDPGDFISLGGKLLFTATGAAGRELWVTDGTAANTMVLKDIQSGAAGSVPHAFTLVGNTLFFLANDGVTGDELWKTDGTSVGTLQVKDIHLGVASTAITNAVALGSQLFFTTDDGVHGVELWKSDGTLAGTQLVKDIVTNPGMGSSPTMLLPLEVQQRVIFTAWDPGHGLELWRSDGTAAGTTLLQDVAYGAASSSPFGAFVHNSRLFFVADDGTTGPELWSMRLADVP